MRRNHVNVHHEKNSYINYVIVLQENISNENYTSKEFFIIQGTVYTVTNQPHAHILSI